jgi:ankyrin repeat protein
MATAHFDKETSVNRFYTVTPADRPMKRLRPLIWIVAALVVLAQLGCGQHVEPAIMNEQLISAAERGDTAAVLRLIADGAAINTQDARGRTPLMAATHANRVETVGALITAGADVNIRDDRKDNPFLYAGAEGLLDILRLTIAAGADTKLTNRFGGTALIPAAERGHVAIVFELLTRTDVDVNHINNLGWTALLEAIVLSDGGPRHQQIVRLLIDHGADVTIADKDGVTPLQHARERGFSEIERMLIQAGAR